MIQINQTDDPRMMEMLRVAEAVAGSKASVLIVGESGTGKELVSRFIHAKSARSFKPFVAINCAALPEGLLESELFGFEKGAFTGATQKKLGKFEIAQGGSFLMDEVSELPLKLQAKLLRVIQEGEVERLGGSGPIKVNVRLIATSNRSLQEMVKKGEFREDLYYRLNVIPLFIPPLRERPRDLLRLSQMFLRDFCVTNESDQKQFSKSALDQIRDFDWPGNVRQLQNFIERAVLLSQGPVINVEDLYLPSVVKAKQQGEYIEAGMKVAEVEKLLIYKTLDFTHQNRTRAADLLGISIRTLRNKINIYKKEVLI